MLPPCASDLWVDTLEKKKEDSEDGAGEIQPEYNYFGSLWSMNEKEKYINPLLYILKQETGTFARLCTFLQQSGIGYDFLERRWE